MPELQWIKWYPQDWLSETGLSLCDIATQGIWANALNWMLRDGVASISGTKEQLARLCRCRPQQIEVANHELKANKVAIVEMQNECIIWKCRRLLKELRIKNLKKKAAAARWCTSDAECFSEDDAQAMQTPMQPGYANTHARSVSVTDSVPLEDKGCGEKKPFDPMNVPEKLKSASFMDAWGRWQNYRRGLGKVKDWAMLFEEQLSFLAAHDSATAELMLRTSMRNGWRGLFEPNDNGKRNQNSGTGGNKRLEGVSRNPINNYAAAAAARSKLAGHSPQAPNQGQPEAGGT